MAVPSNEVPSALVAWVSCVEFGGATLRKVTNFFRFCCCVTPPISPNAPVGDATDSLVLLLPRTNLPSSKTGLFTQSGVVVRGSPPELVVLRVSDMLCVRRDSRIVRSGSFERLCESREKLSYLYGWQDLTERSFVRRTKGRLRSTSPSKPRSFALRPGKQVRPGRLLALRLYTPTEKLKEPVCMILRRPEPLSLPGDVAVMRGVFLMLCPARSTLFHVETPSTLSQEVDRSRSEGCVIRHNSRRRFDLIGDKISVFAITAFAQCRLVGSDDENDIIRNNYSNIAAL